jgi:hypothetical protein
MTVSFGKGLQGFLRQVVAGATLSESPSTIHHQACCSYRGRDSTMDTGQ